MKQKTRYKIRRSSLDITADFRWNYTYDNEYKKIEEAKNYLKTLADAFSQHNIEMHEDYFLDHTLQTKTEILYL